MKTKVKTDVIENNENSKVWVISKKEVDKYVIDYKDAKKEMEKIDKAIDIKDFIKNKMARTVAIKHCDRSYLEFHSACFKKYNKDFFMVFTEHHGSHLYHKDDVECICEWFDNGSKSKILYKQKYMDAIKNEERIKRR